MTTISYLENQKKSYQQKISTEQSKIRSWQKSLDSLNKFKSTVQRSQKNFSSENGVKKQALAEAMDVRTNCITAQKYCAGMNDLFNGVGSKIILIAFPGFLAMISSKQKAYSDSITASNGRINTYNSKIVDIDRRIRMAKIAEQQAKTESGGK